MRLALLVVGVAVRAWGQSLTVDATNSPFVVNAATTYTQITVAAGGTLVANAPLTVTTDMVVRATGRVTCDGWPAMVKLNVTGTLTVDAGGVIEADAKGLKGAPLAGFGSNFGATLEPVTLAIIRGAPSASGGSHATLGGIGFGGSPSVSTYGDHHSLLPGGGGGSLGLAAGAGGGVLDLTAGRLVHNGALRADGGGGAASDSTGGGAGGTVHVSVGDFSGAGLISANGGAGAGSGGAGRIRVLVTSWSFSGPLNAFQAGLQAGNVYVLNTALNQLRVPGPLSLSGGAMFESIVMSAGGSLKIDGRVTVTNPLSISPGSSVTLTSPNALDGLSISTVDGTLNVNATVEQTRDLIVNGTLVLTAELTAPNVRVSATGQVASAPQVTSFKLTVPGTLTVEAGGQITARGMGYPGGLLGQFGIYGTTLDPVNKTQSPGSGLANGGSHGGLGGRVEPTYPLAPTYDDPMSPQYLGGGGGASGTVGGLGGSGGGLLRFNTGAFILDGVVTADGNPGTFVSTASPPAGGAGGTLVIEADSLTGNGGFYARGGAAGGPQGAGGGGGLIRLTAGSIAPSVTLSAAGGSGLFSGAAGQVVQTLLSKSPKIVSTAPTQALVGNTVTYAASATGSGPLTWSLTTAPTGATVSSSGVVSWVAAGTGPQNFSLQASNSSGTDAQVFSIDVVSAPTITSVASTTAVVGVPYAYDSDGKAEAAGTGPVTWATLLGPSNFAIDVSTGVIMWAPPSVGSYSVCLQATNSFGIAQQCFTILATAMSAPADASVADAGVNGDAGASENDAGLTDGGGGSALAPKLHSTPATTAYCGTPYRYSGTRTPQVEGTGPFQFTVKGIAGSEVPVGLTLDSMTGEFSWTPTQQEQGAHPLELVVTNSVGQDSQVFNIVVDCTEQKTLPVGCTCASSEAGLTWLAALALVLTRRRARTWALAALTVSTLAFAQPDTFLFGQGGQGSLTVSQPNQVVNAYALLLSDAAAGTTQLTMTATTGFAAGNLVLIVQSKDDLGGDGGFAPTIELSSTAVGAYEFARVAGVSANLTLTAPLTRGYAGTRTQVIAVPEYTSLTITDAGSITAPAFDGYAGGIVVILADTVVSDGTITVSNAGFRGAPQFIHTVATSPMTCTELEAPPPACSPRGDGPDVSASTRYGRAGIPAGGGGGACRYGGGGGGGHFKAGGHGENFEGADNAGEGGRGLVYTPLTRLIMGGGGGSGWSDKAGSEGGPGGGIIWVRARSILGRGTFDANGRSLGGRLFGGVGGGGAGGSVILQAQSTLSCARVASNGGVGASNGFGGYVASSGGGGAGGLAVLQASTIDCSASVQAGLGSGINSTPKSTFDPNHIGATLVITTGVAAPPTPVVTSPANGAVLFTRMPTITGTSSPGLGVVFYAQGIELTRAFADATGAFSLTSPADVPTGPITLEVAAVDASGVMSGRAGVAVTIDASSAQHLDGGTGGSMSSGPPVITSTPSTTAFCGTPYRYAANPLPAVSGTGPFRFSVEPVLGVPLPSLLTVDETTGEFSWVPSRQQRGFHPLALRVTSALGQTTQTFTVSVECPDDISRLVGCGCTSATGLWPLALFGIALMRRRIRGS